ncbi:Transmembrane protein of unknown function [Tessaracoccus bendigoensis DSM 12906]|uniref:DUF3566 domain-containing protein n=1 Tax=Tessaracoccus bendigoensis DSM 12906 TaxID=1123357 RepID=A0A1M6HDH8_9ACTN|nr:DUF3566 domain-containing protein [Tessaracoccus bendigoensis]SHJ20214.1 Transmembrane protein of unknown function [Tessaracoccus bendigoensis DSM 12906]
MSENSPRWPGRNGSPGLDFSPYRQSEEDETASVAAGAEGAPTVMAETVAQPAVDGPAGQPSPQKPRTPPSARVASTAKEWAAVPVAGMSTPPAVGADPMAPGTPTRDTAAGVAGVPMVGIGSKQRGSRRTRKARLRLSRIDPWSVMKTTLLFSIAFGIMGLVVAFVLWSVLAGSGALESLNTLINTLLGDAENSGAGFRVEEFLTVQRVMGFAVVLAVIDAVIITAVTTLFAFLYNLAATVMGGLEVTLAED